MFLIPCSCEAQPRSTTSAAQQSASVFHVLLPHTELHPAILRPELQSGLSQAVLCAAGHGPEA